MAKTKPAPFPPKGKGNPFGKPASTPAAGAKPPFFKKGGRAK